MQVHRQEEMKAIYRFIQTATTEELAQINNEIRVVHDNLLVFNEDLKSLDSVFSVAINRESIQLNT